MTNTQLIVAIELAIASFGVGLFWALVHIRQQYKDKRKYKKSIRAYYEGGEK